MKYQLLHGDVFDKLAELPDNSIDLIVSDSPYYRVKNISWDKAWANKRDFLEWLDNVTAEFHRVLKPNGSIYMFASPEMAAHVEVMTSKWFCVLNHIRWVKSSGWHNRMSKEIQRQFLSPWEGIIFAEHHNADNYAKGEAGYGAKCDELRGFVFEPLRAYLVSEISSIGITPSQIKKDLGYTSNVAHNWFAISGSDGAISCWGLPTKNDYSKLQSFYSGFFTREYEDLRREYEDLRRPFSVSADVPYTDVWSYKTVKPYKGKHPCEKPYDMIEHIIKASSREGATVLDAFCGSGVTGEAAVKNGRNFIGIDMQEKWVEFSRNRIAAALNAPEQLSFI